MVIGCLFAGFALAQTGASISVSIICEQGQLPCDVTITLWPTSEAMHPDPHGIVSFEELSSGSYHVSGEAANFAPFDTSFVLEPGERASLNVILQPISIMREIVVESDLQLNDVQIITRDKIEQSASSDLPNLLVSESGLDIRDDGSPGGVKTVRIGGSNSNQVLVFLDGRKLNNSGSGEADLSSIPLDWVERISIYRGSQSDFGGEAIGGIIDIVTRNPAERASLSTRAEWLTSYGRLNFSRSVKTGFLSNMLSFTRTEGPGDFTYQISEDDGNGNYTSDLGQIRERENNSIARDQLLLKSRIESDNGGRVELTGTFDQAARGMPGYIAPQLTPTAKQRSQQEAVNIRGFKSLGRVETTGRISFQHDWRRYTNPDPFIRVQETDENSHQLESEIIAELPMNQQRLTGGIFAGQESLSGEQIAGGNADRGRFAGWLKMHHSITSPAKSFAAIFVEPGIRYETYGNQRKWLPKFTLGAEHRTFYSTGLFISWGKSYRAPSLYSLFWLDEMAVRGNPELRAESSNEWTGRAYFESGNRNTSRIEISASDQGVNDLVVWRQTFDNFWKPFNLKKAHVQTLDLMFRQFLYVKRLNVGVGVNWTEAHDATGDRNTGGKYLTYRAPRSYRGEIHFAAHDLCLSMNYRWVAARPVTESNSKWLSEYDVMDMRVAYSIQVGKAQMEASVGMENLLNENYRIVRFAPMPLRQWSAGLQLDWK